MSRLIDTTLWVDYTRIKSPRALKAFVAPHILDPEAHLAEPVVFEMLRCASASEKPALEKHFEIMPMLATPSDLWTKAVELAEECRAGHFTPRALDLLVATIALEHDAEVITFDEDFVKIADNSELRVTLLVRPG